MAKKEEKHPLGDLWGYEIKEDGAPGFAGKIIGNQPEQVIMQVIDAFMFVGCGQAYLTDEIKYLPKKSVRIFMNSPAMFESLSEAVSRVCPSYR